MNLMDKMKYAYTHGEEMPLKGHTKIILEDVRDGGQQIVESDNIITGAVASIIAKNYCGLANLSALLPLRNLYGGVLLFQDEITQNVDNYNPPNDLDNPMIAHAGDEPNTSGSTLRGSPVTNDFIFTDTSIKQVWLWDNTQGNGTIGTVCLCPNILGNMGLKPFDDTYSPVSSFGNDSWSGETWNLEIAKRYPFTIEANGKTAKSVYLDGTNFTEYTMRHDYLAFGIMRTNTDWQAVQNRTATVRSGNNRFIFDDNDYYYIARATSATSMQVDKVSKDTFAVTQADMTFSGVSLYTGNLGGYPNALRTFGFDGTYLYYPNSLGTGMLKLNMTDNTDVLALDGEIVIDKGNIVGTPESGDMFSTPIVINEGLILGSNYIVNGGSVYQIQRARNIAISGGSNFGNGTYLDLLRSGASCYGISKQSYYPTYRQGQANVLLSMFLSSINVLPEQKVKSTSQTMRVEYTLSEQT